MQIHTIQPKVKSRRKKRLGRGGKRGTYSGRGVKGQKARAGAKFRPELRDIIKKIPKKRGYRFHSAHADPFVLNVDVLDREYNNGEIVSPETLKTKHIIPRRMHNVRVKILGKGILDKKLIIERCAFSKSAKVAIEKAGGSIK